MKGDRKNDKHEFTVFWRQGSSEGKGGSAAGGSGKAVQFTETEKQIRVVNPDGTKTILSKNAGQALYDRHDFKVSHPEEKTTIETWTESLKYTKNGSEYIADMEVRSYSSMTTGSYRGNVTTRVKAVRKTK